MNPGDRDATQTAFVEGMEGIRERLGGDVFADATAQLPAQYEYQWPPPGWVQAPPPVPPSPGVAPMATGIAPPPPIVYPWQTQPQVPQESSESTFPPPKWGTKAAPAIGVQPLQQPAAPRSFDDAIVAPVRKQAPSPVTNPRGAYAAAVDDQAQATMNAATIKSEAEQKAATEMQQVEKEAHDATERDRVAFETAASNNDKKSAALSKEIDTLAKTKVDPGRYMRNAGVGGQIASAAGAFLSGLMAPFNNGRNMFLEQLQDVIDRDINAQIQDLDTRRGALGAKANLLQQDFARGMDVDAIRTKYRQALYGHAVNVIQQQAAGSSSAAVKENADAMVAGIRGEAARQFQVWRDGDLDFEFKGAQLDEEQRQAKQRERLGWFNAKDNATQWRAELGFKQDALAAEKSGDDAKARAAAEKDYRERGVGGLLVRDKRTGQVVPFMSRDSGDAKEGAKAVGARNAMQQAIDSALTTRDKYGAEWWSKMPAAQQTQIIRAYAGVYGLAQTTKDEQAEAARAAGGDLGSLRDPSSALRDLSKRVDSWVGNQLNAMSPPGEDRVFMFSPYQAGMPDLHSKATSLPPIEGDERLDQIAQNSFHHESPKVRLGAMIELGKRGDSRTVDYVQRGLADDNESVRLVAAAAIAKMGDPDAIETLAEVARFDPSKEVRARAKKAIEAIRARHPEAGK